MADSAGTLAQTDRKKQYEQGLFPYIVTGNPQGENLILLAGYPDDELSGWAPLIDLLKHKYQIIAVCFPQFDKNPTIKKWAYSFDELIEMLDKTLATTPAANQPYVLLTHDWGAALGYMYENKYTEKVGKMIAVDVGLNVDITWRLVLYQSILAFVYLSSQLLGNTVGSVLFAFYSFIMRSLPFLGPLHLEADLRYYNIHCHPTVDMAYPYFYLYKNILTGNMKKMLSRFPSCPLLFMYGEQKRIMFHGAKFLDKIRNSHVCTSLGFPEAGHWIMHVSPEKMANAIEKFLASHSS